MAAAEPRTTMPCIGLSLARPNSWSASRGANAAPDAAIRTCGLAAICAAPGVLVLDANIAALALPGIRRTFALDPSGGQWVISVYALALGGFLLLGGRVADACDRRIALCGGLGLSAVASIAVGVSTSAPTLIAARFVQGLAAAVAFPAALASLTTGLDARGERFRLAGLFATASAIGFFTATVPGGALIQAVGWRAGFLISPAVAAVAIPLLWLSRPATTRRATPTFDQRVALLEIPLLLAAAAAIVHGLTSAAQRGGALVCAGSLLLGGALAAALDRLVRLDRTTILPRCVVGRRSVRRAAAGAGGVVASGVATTILLSSYLQDGERLSAGRTGLVLAGIGLAGVLAGTVLAGLGRRGSRTWTLTSRIVTQAVGILLIAAGVFAGSMPLVVAAPVLFGAGHFAATARLADLVTAGLSPEHHGVAAGVLQTAQQFGAAVGVALVSGFASSRTGYASGFVAAAVLALAAAGIAGRRGPGVTLTTA